MTSQKQITAFLSGPWPYVSPLPFPLWGIEGSAFIFFLLLKDHCASVPLGKALVHVVSSPRSPATELSFSFRTAGLWP